MERELSPIQRRRRAFLLLIGGAVLGVALGVASALPLRSSDPDTVPDGVIALVNGKALREEDYLNAVASLAGDKRAAVTDEDRAHVLNRMIEEELLIQQGIAAGLVDSDRTVRKAVTQAMLAVVVAESASEQPSEEVLRAFYEENPSLFRPSVAETRVRVEHPPAFAEVREQVEKAYVQRARDDTLREYLQWLRDEAKIAVAPEVSR